MVKIWNPVHTVTIVCKIELGPYEQDLAIEDDYAAVVSVVAMYYGQADVAHDAMDGSISQNDGHLLPSMEVCIRFKDLEVLVCVLKANSTILQSNQEVRI
jgi:hypothetical protein